MQEETSLSTANTPNKQQMNYTFSRARLSNHGHTQDAYATVHLLYAKSQTTLSQDWSDLQSTVLETDLKIRA